MPCRVLLLHAACRMPLNSASLACSVSSRASAPHRIARWPLPRCPSCDVLLPPCNPVLLQEQPKREAQAIRGACQKKPRLADAIATGCVFQYSQSFAACHVKCFRSNALLPISIARRVAQLLKAGSLPVACSRILALCSPLCCSCASFAYLPFAAALCSLLFPAPSVADDAE